MTSTVKQELLRQLPSISDLLEHPTVGQWVADHSRPLVADCLRQTVDELRQQILADDAGRCGAAHVTDEFVLDRAAERLDEATRPHLCRAINATGIILHTALGRAVWPAGVVDSIVEDLKSYTVLAADRETGQRSDRDQRVEYILTELTGAEAATVVNNNAAATMLVLAALASGMETIVSRGQLIEIGGAFRLPDVMALSGTQMVEVGTTNRTHLRDYANAIIDETAILFRAHPSNYRVVGFTREVPLADLADLGRSRGLIVVDDIGAGALVGLERFGLPHEPTVRESIDAGADVVLFSGDKLIGASQSGIIVGRKDLIDRIRKHPLARAVRPDKTCLMALERTLHLFRDVDQLCREHPLYQMLSMSADELRSHADALAAAIGEQAPRADVQVTESVGYLGSGSCPMEQLPTFVVSVSVEGVKPGELARRLRMDEACVFPRVDNERVLLDVRTLLAGQADLVADAAGRAASRQT
ncbi:MAG: L-seryl-tRNA(Sec) selenium transferase [Planctomycetota bacterium]|jgi:L-seryl-tRNA(Ser) seleniumtransferase